MVDKKAQIKAPVKIVTVPKDITRANHLESVTDPGKSSPSMLANSRSSSDHEICPESASRVPESGISTLKISEQSWRHNLTTIFEVACMKKLDEESEALPIAAEEALKIHDPEYAKMIKDRPALMNPSFQKGKPVHGVWHTIDTADHPPSKAKRRPVLANSEKDKMGNKVWDKMLKDGIIEEVQPGSNNDWSSALHLANKPGGGVRPCLDFRILNTKTITDSHPLPLLKDFTKKIHGSVMFSKVDLRSAFFNILIWPAHKHKTLTLSPWGGSFAFNRLPFGLSSGPSSWQKVLEWVLKDVENAFIYLDDILVWGKTKEDHDETLRAVFERLADNKMALSLEKCLFGKSSVDYLGYNVSNTGIKPLPRKLQALKDFKLRTSQKDILHFVGALNYFRTSLKGIKTPNGYKSAAAVLQPLYAVGTDKLPSKVKFKDIWENSGDLKKAFQEAKQMLMEAVELHHPHPDYPLALFTDASDFSLGGSLQMLAPDGSFKQLGFYSAHLSETQ